MGNVSKISATRILDSAGYAVAENFDAIAYMVKDKYRSSCVLKYTKNGLANKLGLSPITLHKAIRWGLVTRRCRIEYGNLIFSPISGQRNVYVNELPKSFKEVKRYLKSILLIDRLRIMKFMRHSKVVKPRNRGDAGECIWNGRSKGSGTISYKGIARLMKMSAKTSIGIVKYAITSGLIDAKVTKARIGLSKSQSGLFIFKGASLCQPCNFYCER